MSILTIGKEETFNNYLPSCHIDKVKAASDAKNNTEDLTFSTPKQKKYDYVSRKAIDGIMDKRILAEIYDDFAHCKDIH